MIETFFVCDRCAGRWETKSPSCPQPVNIGLRLNFGNHSPTPSNYDDARSQVWCRPCIERAGVIVRSPSTNSVVATPPPSTGDILTELLESLGFTRE